MSEWKEYSMSELIEDISMGPFGSNIKVDCFVDSGVPVLNGSNLTGFKLREDSFNFVTKEKADSLNKANAARGDIIVTHRGTLGQIAFIPEDSIYERYVISQSQFRFSCKKNLVNIPFLVYYFHSREGQYKLLANASQVGVPALARPTSSFKEIVISLPAIEEQRKIAGVLSSLDDKIDLLNRENATLEALAETLFRHYFIENPNPDWKEGKLGDIAIIAAGGDKPKNVSNNRTTDTPIPIFSNGIEKDGLYGYTDRAKVFDECVTVSARGTIGFVALRTEPFVPIVRLITLIPKTPMTSKFLYYWAKSTDINGTGTTQQQLTVPDFKETKLLIPDRSSLVEFTEKVNVLHDKIKSNQQQIISLSAQRDTLLPKLMSNEITL